MLGLAGLTIRMTVTSAAAVDHFAASVLRDSRTRGRFATEALGRRRRTGLSLVAVVWVSTRAILGGRAARVAGRGSELDTVQADGGYELFESRILSDAVKITLAL